MIFHSYVFWLFAVSLLCLVAERVRPWRGAQRVLRPELGQDVFWLVFNGVLSAIVFAGFFRFVNGMMDGAFARLAGNGPRVYRVVAASPLALQVVVVLLVSDLLEWCVHNALHRLPWLWCFHRVHHSIRTMDWIGNFRFHWGETLVYSMVKHLPLAVLGARAEALLIVSVCATMIGHLNHANLNISWGPLRYILNSPRMHIWHHEKELRGSAGVNFAVVLSLWDWLFRTAYMPKEALQPEALGYDGMARVSSSLVARFFFPWRGKGEVSSG